MIAPPDYLLPAALPAWRRITSNLERRGAWVDIYRSITAVSAMQATLYVEACHVHGPHAAVTQECRQVARLLLIDMLYLDSVAQLREDNTGCDCELFDLCRPLEGAA